MAHDAPADRRVLSTDTEMRAPDSPFADQGDDDALGGVRGNGETNALRRQDHRGVDADDVARGIDQRPAGIAGIQRRVGLDDVVEQPSRLAAHGTARAR